MPELPEVQTIVSDLKPVLEGLVFSGISTLVPNLVLPSVEEFGLIEGKKVLEMGRRGKFMNIFLEGDFVITIHLRMTGRLLARGLEDDLLRFERTRINFGDVSLRFCDQRKFGRIWLCGRAEFEDVTGQYKLGVEPLSEEFSLGKFLVLAEGRRGSLKRFLLDQSIIAGIGNIYADETCFYAGVRPNRAMVDLVESDLVKIHEGVVKSLEQGIRNRGTSISDYQDAYGKSGKNQELLFVYGRGGKPCLECGVELVKVREAGRGTVYCEGCQA